jgi:hypothetical protein
MTRKAKYSPSSPPKHSNSVSHPMLIEKLYAWLDKHPHVCPVVERTSSSKNTGPCTHSGRSVDRRSKYGNMFEQAGADGATVAKLMLLTKYS